MRRSLILLVAFAAAVALVVAGVVQAAPSVGRLSGTVGPGFTISMSKKRVPHGKYVITIRDKAGIHNFHLTGPGVNKSTSISGKGTFTWRVTLKRGVYRFMCDPHATTMKGTLRVT